MKAKVRDPVRVWKACLAGIVGITANTAMLKLAPLLHLHPGSGGILQLLLLFAKRWVPRSLGVLHSMGLEKPPTLFGFLWFHYVTGMVMILFYFYVFRQRVHAPQIWTATIFAVLVWLINSALVYPALGEGFAGNHQVPASGVLYFFIANWAFVAVSAFSFRTLSSAPDRRC